MWMRPESSHRAQDPFAPGLDPNMKLPAQFAEVSITPENEPMVCADARGRASFMTLTRFSRSLTLTIAIMFAVVATGCVNSEIAAGRADLAGGARNATAALTDLIAKLPKRRSHSLSGISILNLIQARTDARRFANAKFEIGFESARSETIPRTRSRKVGHCRLEHGAGVGDFWRHRSAQPVAPMRSFTRS
jgi:hypothetical protein